MSTYSPIASVTLSSAQSSVTFSGIPQTYTDLVIVGVGYNSTGDGYAPRFDFNSDTGNNYSFTQIGGNGSSASSTRSSNRANIPASWLTGWDTTSTEVGMFTTHIMNYSNTTTNKTVLSRGNQAAGTYPGTEAVVGLWRSTAAITSIRITADIATFASGSTFNLYGILSA